MGPCCWVGMGVSWWEAVSLLLKLYLPLISSLLVPLWSHLSDVAMPCHSCTRIWPQPLPGMGLANSLQQEWCL